MISSGLCLFTYKATEFDWLGFVFLLFASFASGIRWSFAQLIMQKSKIGLHNPVDMVFHMQPWMVLAILPFTLGFEGRRLLDNLANVHEMEQLEILLLFSKLSVGAVIAFAMEISEFLVLSYTSSLTLSVAGIFKEICQLVLAVEINGDQLSVLNVLGLIMCVLGICSHVINKYRMYLDQSATSSSLEGGGGDSEPEPSSYATRGKADEPMTNGGKFYRHKQKKPLLDSEELNHSDSDQSQNGDRNSSEVLFDILKRRDARREI
jgi:solute carrier family 35, member C2